MREVKTEKSIVLIIRVVLDRGFSKLAKKHGYKLKDMREAIEHAGVAELEELVHQHECDERDEK